MRRAVLALFGLLVATLSAVVASATPPGLALSPPSGVAAHVATRSVAVSWQPVTWPQGVADRAVVVARDGQQVAALPGDATAYDDTTAATGSTHSYTVATTGSYGNANHVLTSPPSASVSVTLPAYLVGAATRDITPDGDVNLGGFGLGDGSVLPGRVSDLPFGGNLPGQIGGQDVGRKDIVGRGGHAASNGDRIRSRAIVFGDGRQTIAVASVETQGMFAAYEDGPYGLHDMAERVAALRPGLAVDHILIAADHTHRGPDTIGAWGGVPASYLQEVADRTVAAIVEAYDLRRFASLRAGHSDASDLIYNQSCPEALNQGETASYPGPTTCPTAGKDGLVRALQATAPDGTVVATYMAYAAHATANIGGSLNGDWPQFVSDEMSRRYGGVGLAMVGALGGTQPCRPTCSFTSHDNPGFHHDRTEAIVLNYTRRVDLALAAAKPVTGPVAAAQTPIREAITGPFVLALFTAGHHTGTRLLRSHQNPWVVGETIRTVASALRVGGVLFVGTPGEGFPSIGQGVADAVAGEQEVIQLGLANDQLGYLIAPVTYVAPVAAEVAVNDNIIFNVSPTIGDHVMCADAALAKRIGFSPTPVTAVTADSSTASLLACPAYDAADASGDPVSKVPVGGVVAP